MEFCYMTGKGTVWQRYWSITKVRQEFPERQGLLSLLRALSSPAQSLPANRFLVFKAQSICPLFSSSILSDFIDSTSHPITQTYILHYEH